MGCAGSKTQKPQTLPNPSSPPKDKSLVPPPPQKVPSKESPQQQPQVEQKAPSKDHHSSIVHPKVEQPQNLSMINNSQVKAKSGIQSHLAKDQSSINNTQHQAEVYVDERVQPLVDHIPKDPISNVEDIGEIKSYVESGISRTQNEVRSSNRNKQRSALANIEEDEEKVHEEGVSNFAIPIKNINLHVEVK